MNRIFTLLGTLLFVALMPFISTAGGTYTLSVGQTQTLSFTAREGGKGFVWTSADPSAVEITSQSGTTATVTALRGAACPCLRMRIGTWRRCGVPCVARR